MNPEYTGEIDIGVWRYDPQVGENVRLGDFSATFVRAQSGNYCQTYNGGDVYQIGEAGLTKLGVIPETASFIDMVEDRLYYCENTTFYEYDLRDGVAREIYRDENRLMLEDCYLRDGIIYYRTTYQTADPQFHALDISSGVSEVMHFNYPEAPFHYLTCLYYDDCILVYPSFYGDTEHGLYRLDYETGEATFLLQWEQYMENFYRQGDTLYFGSSYRYRYTYGEVPYPYAKMATCDMTDGSSKELETEIYTEHLYACPSGCYYNDVRGDYPGLYFYNNSTGEAIRIDTAEE